MLVELVWKDKKQNEIVDAVAGWKERRGLCIFSNKWAGVQLREKVMFQQGLEGGYCGSEPRECLIGECWRWRKPPVERPWGRRLPSWNRRAAGLQG